MGNIKIRYLTEASSAEVYSGNLLAGALGTAGGFAELTRGFNFNQVVSGGSGALGGPGSPFVFNDTSTEQVFQGGISAPGIALMGNLDITGRISGLVDGYFNNLYITGSDSQWYQVTTGWSGAGGSSPWTQETSNIFYDDSPGKVGIGDWAGTAPPYGLTVKEKDGIVVSENVATSALGTQFLIIGGAEMAALNSPDYGVSIKLVRETNFNGYGMAFWGRKSTADPAATEKMRLSHSGNLGIGTDMPTERLHVSGGKILAPTGEFVKSLTISGVSVATGEGGKWSDGAVPGQIYYDGGNVGVGTPSPVSRFAVHVPSTDFDGIAVFDETSTPGINPDGIRCSMGLDGSDKGEVRLLNPTNHAAYPAIVLNAGGPSVFSGVDVGIGERTPLARLHVTGGDNRILAPSGAFTESLTISGVSVATGEGGGGGGSSPWFELANNIYYNDNPGTVGIGVAPTAPPPCGLTVQEKGGIAVTEDTFSSPFGTQYLMIQGGNHLAPDYGSSIKLVKEGPLTNDFGMSFWTMDNPTFADEKMRLSSVGKLGIGITDPTSKLHVDGNITCGNRLIVSGNADVSGYGLFGDGLKVSGAAEISGILSVSTDSPTEGGQFVLNLPGSSGPAEGAGNFSIDAFKDATDAYGFGPNSGLFRMFHGGGGAGGAPATQILATSSGGAVVLGGGVSNLSDFAKLTLGRGTPYKKSWGGFESSNSAAEEDGIAIYARPSAGSSMYGATWATLALIGGSEMPGNYGNSSISSNHIGLHIRNHNTPASSNAPMNIVFDLTYNTTSLGKAPALQLSGQDNAVILDFDSLPTSNPGVKGQIYRNVSTNALYVSP